MSISSFIGTALPIKFSTLKQIVQAVYQSTAGDAEKAALLEVRPPGYTR
jgi:hypothetical protein